MAALPQGHLHVRDEIMKALPLAGVGERLSILCLGAHADDIEIGAGATLLALIARGVRVEAHWCVLSASGVREGEARASAADFLAGATSAKIEVMAFKDAFFPQQSEAIKSWFEELKLRVDPDVILTHCGHDAHQDHREVCRLTWNTFRDHCILEYEIPKWDGDIGQPNVYVSIPAAIMARKVDLLGTHYASQRPKHWFDVDVFRGLARVRGMECHAPEKYAEAFFARKLSLI
jgi:LmbE family N-acetylglucosaminyl deacetylase